MKRALRCLRFVALGIVGVAAACAAIFGGFACLFWLSYATANLLDVPQHGLLFVAGYFVTITGVTFGAILCAEDRS